MLDPVGRFQRIDWVESTGSTNADLVAEVRAGLRVPVARFTDLQTAGRGRRDRAWDMVPGGGLLVSFFVPWSDAASAHRIPSALAVAAVDAVAEHGRTVGLKWPNDLLTKDARKVAGMLAEMVSAEGGIAGVVVGIGCNVSWRPPDQADRRAAMLDELAAEPIDRPALGRSLCAAFDRELEALAATGPGPLADRVRARSYTIGSDVRVEQADGVLVGRATDIDEDGRLILDVDGWQHRIEVGDVVHARPEAR